MFTFGCKTLVFDKVEQRSLTEGPGPSVEALVRPYLRNRATLTLK